MQYGPNDFTIGLSELYVFDSDNNSIDLGGEVASFTSNSMYDQVDAKTIANGGRSKFRDMPTGWEGSFTVLRYDDTLEQLFYSIDQTFYNTGVSQSFHLEHHRRNADGTITVWRYTNAQLRLTQDGDYTKDGAVMQTVSFRAVDREPA